MFDYVDYNIFLWLWVKLNFANMNSLTYQKTDVWAMFLSITKRDFTYHLVEIRAKMEGWNMTSHLETGQKYLNNI